MSLDFFQMPSWTYWLTEWAYKCYFFIVLCVWTYYNSSPLEFLFTSHIICRPTSSVSEKYFYHIIVMQALLNLSVQISRWGDNERHLFKVLTEASSKFLAPFHGSLKSLALSDEMNGANFLYPSYSILVVTFSPTRWYSKYHEQNPNYKPLLNIPYQFFYFAGKKKKISKENTNNWIRSWDACWKKMVSPS